MDTSVFHVLLFLVGVYHLVVDVAGQGEVHDERGWADLVVVRPDADSVGGANDAQLPTSVTFPSVITSIAYAS